MSHGLGNRHSAIIDIVDVGTYANDLLHALSDEVCANANLNEPRWAAYNILDRGDPNNRMMQDLLGQGLDYLDLKINGRRESPRQAVQHVAEEVVLFFLSKLCKEDQSLMRSLHREQQQEMYSIYNNFVGPVNRDIEEHMYALQQRQAQMQSASRFDHRGGQGRDFSAPSYHSAHGRTVNSHGGHRGHGTGGRPEFMNKSGHGLGTGTMSGFSSGTTTRPTLQRKSPLAVMNKRVEPVVDTRREEPKPRQVREDYRPKPSRSESQPKQGNIMPHAPAVSGAIEVQQSLNSNYELSHKDGIKYVTVFDPTQEVGVYIVGADGNVTDAYKPRTEENAVKFADHNYEMFFAPKTPGDKAHKPNRQVADAALNGVSETRSVEQLMTDIEKQRNITPELNDVPLFEGYHLQLDEPITTIPPHDHRTALDMYFIDNGIPVDPSTSVISFTRQIVRPWILSADKCVALRMASLTHSWAGVKAILDDLEAILPSHHWTALHTDVTKQVNEILVAVHGIRYEVDHFCLDINELLEAIAGDPNYGQVAVENFEKSCELVVTSVLQPQIGNDLLIAHGYDINDPAVGKLWTDPMGLYLIEDVTLLPIHSRDLSFAKGERVAQVSAAKTPALHKALSTRLKAADNSASRVVLVTLDNQVINAFMSIVDDSIVVMTA